MTQSQPDGDVGFGDGTNSDGTTLTRKSSSAGRRKGTGPFKCLQNGCTRRYEV